jgi:acyl carrier protein
MTCQDFNEAIQAKVQGTWNLHHAAQNMNCELDIFIMLSSVSGIIGVGGQANYAAANAFLDSFAAYRHGMGLRAHCIDLGVIEDVGYLNLNRRTANRIEARQDVEGIDVKGIDERTLHKIIKFSILQQTQTMNPDSACQMITGLPVPVAVDSPLLSDARFSTLVAGDQGRSEFSAGAKSNVDAFIQMVKANIATTTLVKEAVQLVNQQLVRNMGLVDDIEPGKTLSTYGIDSLAAVDLRNWVRMQLKAELTTLDILNAPTLLVLGERIVDIITSEIDK